MVIYIIKPLVLKLQRLMVMLLGGLKDSQAFALVCLRVLCCHGAYLIKLFSNEHMSLVKVCTPV
jgi:hypothetical protein